MATIYADEDVPSSLVIALRNLGHDVLTVRDAGKSGQAVPDHQVLADAFALGRVLLSKNRRDFIRLHNQGHHHCGIVVFTEDLDYTGLSRRVHDRLMAAQETQRFLCRVNREPRRV